MGVLASARNRKQTTPGRWIMVPRSDVTQPTVRRKSRVIKRRRQNFERLLAAAGVTFLAGFVPALRWMWFVHLAVDGALGFYVTRLLRYKRDEQGRPEIVEHSKATGDLEPPVPAVAEPASHVSVETATAVADTADHESPKRASSI